MKFRRSSVELFHRVYQNFNEFREAVRDSILPPNVLLLGLDGSVLLSIPQWSGFSSFSLNQNFRGYKHWAQWGNHFMGGRVVFITLQIDWEVGQRLRLGFSYPDYREILERIWERRSIGLIDKPLRNGFIDPRSRCLLVEDLPPWGVEVV